MTEPMQRLELEKAGVEGERDAGNDTLRLIVETLTGHDCTDEEAGRLALEAARAVRVEREDQDRRIEELTAENLRLDRDYREMLSACTTRTDERDALLARAVAAEARAERWRLAAESQIDLAREIAAERDELRAKVAAVEAERDAYRQAWTRLSNVVKGETATAHDPRQAVYKIEASLRAALAAASPGDGLGVWCCPAGHEIDQAGMCACDPPAPEWTFEDVDDEHTLITIRHADGSEIKYRVRRRPLFGASPGDEETDDV